MYRFIFLPLFILGSAQFLSAQYLETFSTPNKGLLAGPCGTTASSCGSTDFVGVDWTVTGDFSGFDGDDTFATNSAGVLFIGGDIDEEMCYESPELAIIGSTSFTVDLEWIHHDNADYIDVEYMVDGSVTWIQIPNQFGGQTHTVDFPGTGATGAGTITSPSISGTTLKVRVCADSNTSSSGEAATVDNLNVMGAVLPVTWNSVEASVSKEGNLIEWSTANETNNDYFEIQKRNEDQVDFVTVGMVEGQGDSYRVVDYSFIDRELTTSGTYSYYRVKQVDLDGDFSLSEVVSVRHDLDYTISMFPNPFSNVINFKSESEHDNGYEVTIHDVFGNVVLQKKIDAITRFNSIDTNDVPPGVYFLTTSLDRSGQIFVKK